MRHLVRCGYVAYAYAAFAFCGLAALVGAHLFRDLERRRAVAQCSARLFLRLAGMPLTVRGLDRLPAGQCVVVANHASYLDGLVFTAALPPRFAFVIKREMARVPLAGTMLRRIGAEFVERFDHRRGAADARRVLRQASRGRSLVFFPEGTFSGQPGLMKFHAGAFVTAARVGCPVVPAIVRGTRKALPPGGLIPHPSRVILELLPALSVSRATSSQLAAAELRARARAVILSELREPDLDVARTAAATVPRR